MSKKKGGKKKQTNNVKQAAPDKKYGPIFVVGIVIIAAFAIIVSSGKSQTAGTAAATGAGGNTATTAAASATALQQTDIPLEVAAGNITVDEAAVRKAGSTYFEYKTIGKTVPLMAYVGPSGKIVTAVSLCEPCRGQKFRIEGDKLICNTCGSIWIVETHKPVSGSCQAYPPDFVPATLENGKVVIPEANVANWKARV